MKKPDEQIFIGIWKLACKEAKKASQITTKDKLFSKGGIAIDDKRKKFTKWLIQTKKGIETDNGVYISGGGGQCHSQASEYANKFCKILKHFGITTRSDVSLD